MDFDGAFSSFPDEESPTLVTCAACGGDWRIVSETRTGVKMSVCPHCVRGAMTPKQAVAWRAKHPRSRT